MDWPPDGKLLIRSLAGQEGKVESVGLLGDPQPLTWTRTADGLRVTLPDRKPCDHAYALKITGTALHATPVEAALRPAADRSFLLGPSAADLHGEKIRVQQRHDDEFIAAWDRPEDWAEWPLLLPPATTYDVQVVCSAAAGETQFTLEMAGTKLSGKAKRTRSWFDYQTLPLGTIRVAEGGKHNLVLRAGAPQAWKPLNIREIRLRAVN